MAEKKFIIRSFKPGETSHNHVNPLLNLSTFGLNGNQNIMQYALAYSASQTKTGQLTDYAYQDFYSATGQNRFIKYQDLTKANANNYAFYDMTYNIRCNHCKQLARDIEINTILETICDQAIVQDQNGLIADLDLEKLKLFLNKNYKSKTLNADKLINDCQIAFNNIYSAYGWSDNNGAWNYFKKFLIEGFLAFEMILDESKRNIIGFLNLDPTTLQPDIEYTEDGQELFIWYQYKGSANQRKIPNSNLIYISWGNLGDPKNNNISYVEGLSKPYTVLKQLEGSHIVWNTLNAQNRMKLTIPVGDVPKTIADMRISEIKADYDEEVSFDDASGQVLVNGEPKFNFQKTYIFEDRNGQSINLEAVKTDGYNMNTTEELQYFWRKFILQSQVPANRFNLNINQPANNALFGDSNITREEYAFSRFIGRIQNIFKELLLKPTYTQICLKHPEFSHTEYLKQGLGILFKEENSFVLAKERAALQEGVNAIGAMAGLTVNEKPYFAMEFLIKKFLGMSDDDIALNNKYKQGEILHNIEIAKLQKKHMEQNQNLTSTPQPGAIEGGDGGGFGGGGFSAPAPDMGGGDMGGAPAPDMGGGDMGGAEETPGGEM